MRRLFGSAVCAALVIAATLVTLQAHAPSGAIFTTLEDGSEVNFNIYPSKDAVYLDGGPGPGAPQGAAGLDDGTYVFQVTNPSGRVLLSQDVPACRRFTVVGGVISGLVTTSPTCAAPHLTGLDIDHSATTVQLMPYADTPNPGGVYKVWVTRVEDFQCSLTVQDCGNSGNVGRHGFLPAHSKTDNYKVDASIIEIDTRFFPDYNGNGLRDSGEDFIDGLGITWQDTNGATNRKWSYYAPWLVVYHEAHVEQVEDGRHKITIQNQAGCTVGAVSKNYVKLSKRGPQTVTVNVPEDFGGGDTVFIDVACIQ